MREHPHLITHRKIGEHRRFAPLRHRGLIGVLDALGGDREDPGQRPPGVSPAAERPRTGARETSRRGGPQGLDDAVEIIGRATRGRRARPARYRATKGPEPLALAGTLRHPECMDH